ncbi:MAG: aldo/keto reductase [Candidatus Latescibacteria bacterium]|jgi:aryl-alcohol dehydrogenase-like predicted oxidoreductase|nr:aldo/keto reductase [Candidatus Latescibacterota bacterium]
MEYIELGTTGQQVSALALGCMSLERESLEASKATVRRAFELGITFYDTADVYGRGESEEILGEAIQEAGIAREDIVVASKCGIVFPGMVEAYTHKAYDLSPAYLKTSCEASLKRLKMEYLDLYQPHRIEYLTHPEETARALEDLESEGKIRHAGVSNYTVDEIRALATYTRLESLQTKFSLLELEPLETGLAAICQEKKMSVLCYSPNHGGVLAGASPPAHSDWQEQREQGVVTQTGRFAEQYGLTLSQISLAWLMQLPGGVIPLVGTANPAHIEEAARASGVRLGRDDWYELLVIARGRPMPWKQRPFAYFKER